MSSRRQITIHQVARAAGVSPQTVSRVINDRPDVAVETRARVQAVIERLGYRPNALARGLIRQRSLSIGVVAMPGEYVGPAATLAGIEKGVRALGYSLLLDLLHHPETPDVDRILGRLLSQQVDGILWAVPEIGENRAWLEAGGQQPQVPMIFLSMAPRPELAVAAIDNHLGGRLAAEHLLAEGRSRVGIITGPLEWWESRQRLEGWQEALRAAGLPAEPFQIASGNWSAASGERALQELLACFPKMDALFASNDQMALGALLAAHRLGRRIPLDLAVVGFDNIPESAYYWPPLTTIEQPFGELGGLAVKRLSRMIDASARGALQQAAGAFLLEPRLIVRESSHSEAG